MWWLTSMRERERRPEGVPSKSLQLRSLTTYYVRDFRSEARDALSPPSILPLHLGFIDFVAHGGNESGMSKQLLPCPCPGAGQEQELVHLLSHHYP